MSCNLYAKLVDRKGRLGLSPADAERLDAHLRSCKECVHDHNRREVARLTLEVIETGSVAPDVERLLEATPRLVAEATRRRREPEIADVLAEVVPLVGRWLPRLAAAAVVALAAGGFALSDSLPALVAGGDAAEVATAIVAPNGELAQGALLEAVLAAKGGAS